VGKHFRGMFAFRPRGPPPFWPTVPAATERISIYTMAQDNSGTIGSQRPADFTAWIRPPILPVRRRG